MEETWTCKAACVIGWPVEHSRSPLIHNEWIRQFGLNAAYRREPVPPARFADFVARLADHGYVGGNVTVPHKEAALALSKPDALAQAIGAANTLWLDGGVLRSTNTDVEGFVASLEVGVPGWAEEVGPPSCWAPVVPRMPSCTASWRRACVTSMWSTAAWIGRSRCGGGSATGSCRPRGTSAMICWSVPGCW